MDDFFPVAEQQEVPRIEQAWIYSMAILGVIGCLVTSCIIVVSAYKLQRSTNQKLSKLIIALYFTIWTCNFLACLFWAFFRSNLLFESHAFTTSSCTAIYIANFLCFMIAKYSMHILLLYRLYSVFQGTLLALNKRVMQSLVAIITLCFVVFTALWLTICLQHVTVGRSSQSDNMAICTMYNSASADKLTLYEEIWPSLLGGQDFVVGAITLILFVKKIKDLTGSHALHTQHAPHDIETETLIRKLSILGSLAIVSTFVFYTFAIPFWPNLTFLLPFDATVNSLCIVLLLDYASSVYRQACVCLDKPVQKVLKHANVDESGLADVMEMSNASTNSISMRKIAIHAEVPRLAGTDTSGHSSSTNQA